MSRNQPARPRVKAEFWLSKRPTHYGAIICQPLPHQRATWGSLWTFRGISFLVHYPSQGKLRMHLKVTLVFVIAIVLFCRGGGGFGDAYLIKTLKKDVQRYFSTQHILVCTTCHYYPLFLFSNTPPPLFPSIPFTAYYYSGTGTGSKDRKQWISILFHSLVSAADKRVP